MRTTTSGGLVSILALACGTALADDGRTLDVVSVRADSSQAPRALDVEGSAVRYPRTALAWRREGRAVVAAAIGPDGRVTRVELRESSGDAGLDRAALALVQDRRFAPAIADGAPVASLARVPVDFALAQR